MNKPIFRGLREAAGIGEGALVSRPAWRAVEVAIGATDRRFTAMLAGERLCAALDQAGEGSDFAGWLARTIEQRWPKDVRLRAD